MMRLESIAANRHLFEGRVNGKPVRLRLTFGHGPSLRLQVAGDGERLIVDEGPLDEPFDMGEGGRIDVADVTGPLFPQLGGAEVSGIRTLVGDGRPVGIRLDLAGGGAFHFWADGDELHWGDDSALERHDWPGAVPQPAGLFPDARPPGPGDCR